MGTSLVFEDIHRGVFFEIRKWKLGDMTCWNYYLNIKAKQLSEETLKEATLHSDPTSSYPRCDYENGIFADLDWHGGITFYEKIYDSEGRLEGFKVGCDYQHYFDQKRNYTYDMILDDCFHSIDKLWEKFPDLKIRCSWDGSYHRVDECYQGYTDENRKFENRTDWSLWR
jgi:hypothetical protein